MSENAELTVSRSTVLVLLSVLILCLLIALTLDDLGVPGTFSRQLLFFSGIEQASGWGAPSETRMLFFRPEVVNAAMPFGGLLVGGVVASLISMRVFLSHLTPLRNAAFFGAAVYALVLFTAPMRPGIIAGSAFIPLIFLYVSTGATIRVIVCMSIATVMIGDPLTSFLVAFSCAAFERKQRVLVRCAPLLAFAGTIAVYPEVRAQLIGGVAMFHPNSYAAEIFGWVSPDLHAHPLGAAVIALLLLLRARSDRPFAKPDHYFLLAAPSYLLFSSTLPLFAATAAVIVALEASGWERKDPAVQPPHWSFVSVTTILSAALGFHLSQINAPWIETESVRQLRSQLIDVQNRGPMLADARFGTALLGAGFSPFVDTRAELYSAGDLRSVTGSAFSDYEELVKLRPRWEEVLQRYQFKVAVLPDNLPLRALLQARRGWREIGAGGSWEELDRGQRKSRYLALLVAPE